MTEQEIIYTMALTRVPRVNTAAQHRLMEELGSASAVFDHRHHIRDFYPEASDKLSATLQEMEVQVARAEEELEFTRKHHIKCLCYHDTDYPSRLRECDDAPLLLYYKGNADLNRTHVINMVGTRHCTEYGKDICRRFVAELANLCPDVLVVSGLAYGIDIHSHRAALDNAVDTVGVLAHGLDQIYPRLHRDTAVQMTSQGGLLTEFMSRTNADKVNFVRRNRIVAGMSDAVVLVGRKRRRTDYGGHRHELPPRCVRLSGPRGRPLLTRLQPPDTGQQSRPASERAGFRGSYGMATSFIGKAKRQRHTR